MLVFQETIARISCDADPASSNAVRSEAFRRSVASGRLAESSGSPPPSSHRPLRTLFLLTSMPVGGAETLLASMLDRFHPDRVVPSVACLKEPGALGETLLGRWPMTAAWLTHKYDVGVVHRLARYLRRERLDALVTVGAGDKMFWGRIAARMARLPVVCCALHSTGWPDGLGLLNRCLTPWTDRFIAVASSHGEYLATTERLPREKIAVIPNGVDTLRFRPDPLARGSVRDELGVPSNAPLVGIVAALRPEKNHRLFLEMARDIARRDANATFIIVGDGPERPAIEDGIHRWGLENRVRLLGSRSDMPRLVAAMDVLVLTSHNEASPVSILEALACGIPVVSTRVGSVPELVADGQTGYIVPAEGTSVLTARVWQCLQSSGLRSELGARGRILVQQRFSLESMVAGYESLLAEVYRSKTSASIGPH